ncbi:MAG: hypothetical protein K2X27_05290 [Candidatus Obscuribacterales bacterium]|nr:hypothetical protein [Candidatus Obscuribacterales bacterium]
MISTIFFLFLICGAVGIIYGTLSDEIHALLTRLIDFWHAVEHKQNPEKQFQRLYSQSVKRN